MNNLNSDERLEKQMQFLIEIDKLKNIYRQTYVLHENRKENDSEHSWHLAMFAFLLAEHSNQPVDILHVIKMVLIHDIVEIDAGDTYCYDTEGYKNKSEREQKAAQRLFNILPDDQKDEIYALWTEFEEMQTPEAKFAASLDRLQPLSLNYQKDGLSWKEHDITVNQVVERNSHIANGSDKLWAYAESMINDYHEKGILK